MSYQPNNRKRSINKLYSHTSDININPPAKKRKVSKSQLHSVSSIKSNFQHETDHHLFVSQCESIKNSELCINVNLPILIIKEIAEYGNGYIVNCANEDCIKHETEILKMKSESDSLGDGMTFNKWYCEKCQKNVNYFPCCGEWQFGLQNVRKHKLSVALPVIVWTQLSPAQIDILKHFKTTFSNIATFRNTWNHNVTHVITSATLQNNNGRIPVRTIKYFQGLISGSWILCFDWIEQCLNKNRLVSEDEYEVPGDMRGTGACRKSRELRQNKSDNGLFSNIICIISPQSQLPFAGLRHDLTIIFKVGGAKVLKIFPYEWFKDINKYKKDELEMNGKIMVFVHDGQVNEMSTTQWDFFSTFGVLSIGYKQVFDAISNYKSINELEH